MVSVIIVGYNQASVLPWLLLSLEKQDYKGGFEVIVCDDGSSEEVLPVVSKFADRGKLDLRFVWQPNRGCRLPHSRNNGIACARGDILVFTESDCVVPPDWISTHVRTHQRNPRKKLVVGGTRAWVDLDLKSPRVLAKLKTLPQLEKACRARATYPDRERQFRQSKTRLPWTACWGFNFSVRKRPEVRFDESVLGYGYDDYELFCRLCHLHRYSAVLRKDAEVFHVSMPAISSRWNPWVEGSSAELIGGYIRRLLRLYEMYPRARLTEAMWPLLYFRIDSATKQWRRVRPGEHVGLPEAIMAAQAWADSKDA